MTCGSAPFARAQETSAPTPVQPVASATSRRPFSGLFGGASAADDRKQSLDLTGSVFAAYFKTIGANTVSVGTGPQEDRETIYTGANATLRYSRRWDAASVGAYASGGLAYLPEERSSNQDAWLDRWSVAGNASYSKPLGRKTTFGVSGATAYSPYFEFGNSLFAPGTIIPPPRDPGLDFVVARDPSIGWTGRASVVHQISLRSSLDLFYGIQGNNFLSDSAVRNDRLDQFAGGLYRHKLNRYVSVRAGYTYRLTDNYTPELGRVGRHEFDVGLDGSYGLGRSYAISRRTSFSFRITPSVFIGERYRIQEEAADDLQTVSDPSIRLYVGGQANLQHTWGRTWAASAAYVRSAGYEVGFDRPVLSDTASAVVSGLLAPRVDFTAAVAYTSGAVGFSGPNRGFGTTTARASLRATITTLLAAYAQYFYYRYNFEEGVRLPSDLSPQLDRQGASVGLSLWLPLL